eukprot:m.17858 g.17858  ORF g.17858 m.17858 type:complete len:169 (-) comp11707_c0_seq1:876-1382(-)
MEPIRKRARIGRTAELDHDVATKNVDIFVKHDSGIEDDFDAELWASSPPAQVDSLNTLLARMDFKSLVNDDEGTDCTDAEFMTACSPPRDCPSAHILHPMSRPTRSFPNVTEYVNRLNERDSERTSNAPHMDSQAQLSSSHPYTQNRPTALLAIPLSSSKRRRHPTLG